MSESLPASAKIARLSSFLFYFTGRPCKHGHISKRLASNFTCYECHRILTKQRKYTSEQIIKRRMQQRYHYRRRKLDQATAHA